MPSTEIATQIIQSASSQIDLISTLSVGICAGIAALYIQVAIHNHGKESSKLFLKWNSLLLVSFFLEGISILLGYCAYGAITDATPVILSLEFDSQKIFSEYIFNNSVMIRSLSIGQFLFFLGGILCVFICLMKNRMLIN